MRDKNNYFPEAMKFYRPLLIFGLAYVVAVAAQAYICGVPFGEFLRVGLAFMLVAGKCVMLLLGMWIAVFIRSFLSKEAAGKGRYKFAQERTGKLTAAFIDGEVFAYACVSLLVLLENDFFFIQKSLINYLNPYAWDNALAVIDRALHFGRYPHEWLLPVVDALKLGRLLDFVYFFWFAVMYLGLGYNLFWDTNRKRKMQFLSVFLMCWVFLGSVLAVVFSATGPVFYHDFYPGKPDPYADFVTYIDAHGPKEFPIAYKSRFLLLGWMHNDRIINVNAVSAFPSMHIAISWLVMLYAFSVNRVAGFGFMIFTGLIFMSTILFGYHYAIDGYASIICVSIMWWAVGKGLDRRLKDAPPLKRI